MNCKHCYRTFTKRHKITDTCLKCAHLIKRGRTPVAVQSPVGAKFAHSNQATLVKEESGNPLLDWMDKKI